MPPGRPGYAPGPMPPPKSSSSIVIIVVVVVVVVLVAIIGLAAILYVAVSGLGPGSTPTNPTVILQNGGWNNGNDTVSITSVTNGGSLAPSDLTYTIETSSGPYYSGAAGANDARGGPTVNVVYNDLTAQGAVSSGDGIRVKIVPSTSTALEGASLRVFRGGTQIGVVTLS
jgi:hypothetical protein